MTAAEKLTMLKSLLTISDTAQDTQLSTYLDLCKRELIAWRYGLANKPPIARAVDSAGNAVNVSVNMFIAAVSPVSGTSYVFTYSVDSWQYNAADIELADYGLSVSGDPIDGETITVKYTEAPLGEFDMVIVSACVAGYGLSGLENQTGSSENGISRQFKYSDMLQYIRSNVPAYCGVI